MAEQSVALISAASALAGVTLTGAFTLLKGRQERLDKQLDRDEQRHIMHREARREAYVAFLTAYHEVERKFEEAGRIIPPPHDDEPIAPELPAAEASIMALKEAGATVALEGPPEMRTAADRVVSACWALLEELAQVNRDNVGQSQRLWLYDAPDRDETQAELDRAVLNFQEAARGVLGGNAPGLR
jgi:hypothetical protein